MDDEYKSVCDGCDGERWDCAFCCDRCYEDYGECPDPECDPWDI